MPSSAVKSYTGLFFPGVDHFVDRLHLFVGQEYITGLRPGCFDVVDAVEFFLGPGEFVF